MDSNHSHDTLHFPISTSTSTKTQHHATILVDGNVVRVMLCVVQQAQQVVEAHSNKLALTANRHPVHSPAWFTWPPRLFFVVYLLFEPPLTPLPLSPSKARYDAAWAQSFWGRGRLSCQQTTRLGRLAKVRYACPTTSSTSPAPRMA